MSSRLIAFASTPGARAAATVGFLLIFFYYLVGFNLLLLWPLLPRGDSAIIYRDVSFAIAHGAYPPEIFPYSPSALLLFASLTVAGPVVFASIWYPAMAASLATSLRGSLARESEKFQAAWPLFGAIGLIVAGGASAYDLRSSNCNLIYLGLTMAGFALLRRRPALAGALVGISVSLKLYSGLIPVWLLVNGQKRAFLGCVAVMFVLWIVAALLLFGIGGSEALYLGWLEQIKMVGDLVVHAQFYEAGWQRGPQIVTLRRAIVSATGGQFDSTQTLVWLRALWAVWLAALAAYAWRWRKVFPRRRRFARRPCRLGGHADRASALQSMARTLTWFRFSSARSFARSSLSTNGRPAPTAESRSEPSPFYSYSESSIYPFLFVVLCCWRNA